MNQQWIELVPSFPTLTEYEATSKSTEPCVGRYMVRPLYYTMESSIQREEQMQDEKEFQKQSNIDKVEKKWLF